jgi:hypothetical protein
MSLARCLVALLAARVGASTHLFLPVSYARAFVGRWRPQTFGGQLLSSSATVAAYTRAIIQLTHDDCAGVLCNERDVLYVMHCVNGTDYIASVIWGHEHAPTLDDFRSLRAWYEQSLPRRALPSGELLHDSVERELWFLSLFDA